MQKLHLVGFTTDHEGLILSARRGARSGSYLLTIDEAVEEAVEERRARREEEPDTESVAAGARRTRVESALPVREIQARLRQGRSIAEVARAAGVDAEWVDRFAPPVLAERAQVISKVQSVPLRRARLGPSELPIGDAVRHHLADRGVSQTPDEFAAAWTARQVADGRWAVLFTFHHRGHDQVLRFDLDEATGEVSTADRTSGQMGYVAPRTSTHTASSAERARPSRPAPEPRPIAKRAVVSTGFRPDPTAKAVSRSAKEREKAAVAMRKAAAKRAVEGERAAARMVRERRVAAARREREEAAAAARAAREALAAQRAAEEAARVKKAAAEKAAEAKKAAAATAKAGTAKASTTPTRATAKKAVAKKPVAKQAVAKQATARKSTSSTAAAKRVSRKRAVARKTVAKSPPRKRVTTKQASNKRPAKSTRTKSSSAPAVVKRATTRRVAASTPTRRPTAKAAKAVVVRPVPPASTPAQGVPARRAPAREQAVRSAPVVRAARAAPPSTDGAGLTGAAENVYGMESARAMFRRGLVEQASGDLPVADAARPHTEPPPNGAALLTQRPVPDRPRRTRPLRAT